MIAAILWSRGNFKNGEREGAWVDYNKDGIVNDEYHHGKPMQLRLGDPMPEEVKVLPHPDELNTEGTKQSRDPAACWM